VNYILIRMYGGPTATA